MPAIWFQSAGDGFRTTWEIDPFVVVSSQV